MAGEWIQVDCNIASKSEVEELIDLTGADRGEIVGRMVMLWSWAALNCEDGVARMTTGRLCRMFGGDDAFWASVQRVGWLEVGQDGQTVAIPGWERRFSKSAKNRACHADRAESARASAQKRTDPCATAHEAVRESAPNRGERGEREEFPPPPPRVDFEILRQAWNKGPGKPWTPPRPPKHTQDRLLDPEWWPMAVQAIDRLRVAKYFDTPCTLSQFVMPGFVEKILGGTFDAPKGAGRPADGTPTPQGFKGRDLQAFEATRAAQLAKLRELA